MKLFKGTFISWHTYLLRCHQEIMSSVFNFLEILNTLISFSLNFMKIFWKSFSSKNLQKIYINFLWKIFSSNKSFADLLKIFWSFFKWSKIVRRPSGNLQKIFLISNDLKKNSIRDFRRWASYLGVNRNKILKRFEWEISWDLGLGPPLENQTKH